MQTIHEGDRVTDSTGQYHGKVVKIYDRFTVGITWAGGTVPTVEHSVNVKLESVPKHQSTSIRYFNGRRYHVLATFTRLAFTQTVFINDTQRVSWRAVWFEDL